MNQEDLFVEQDVWDMNEIFFQVMKEYNRNPAKYGPRGLERIIPGDNGQSVYDWEEDIDLDL